MENLKYLDIREEVDNLIREAVEEVIKHGSTYDLDELQEKFFESLHETIDGHEWVIYYSKAEEVCHRLRNSDSQWWSQAQESCRDCGGMEIGQDEDLDNLYCRLAYHILETGCQSRYEEILEEIIAEDMTARKEAGKAWAQGFRTHNASRESAYEAEENGRQYSPFELVAHEINSLPWSEDAWEAFQEGIDEVFADMPSREDADYWVCDDCRMIIVNDDASGLSEEEAEKREKEIREGIAEIGVPLAYLGEDWDEEFSTRPCECCGSRLAGTRYGMGVIRARSEKKSSTGR